MPARTERALSMLLKVAAGELRQKGFRGAAEDLEDEWENKYRAVLKEYTKEIYSYDIGDHKPLSQWLAEKYAVLELLLGVEACKRTHLSDLKTFNFTIPVVFRPCTFEMDLVLGERKAEYVKHFNEGEVYYGLFPVTAYWGAYASCGFATAGSGFVLVCGLAGTAAEKLAARVGDNIGERIWNRRCLPGS